MRSYSSGARVHTWLGKLVAQVSWWILSSTVLRENRRTLGLTTFVTEKRCEVIGIVAFTEVEKAPVSHCLKASYNLIYLQRYSC